MKDKIGKDIKDQMDKIDRAQRSMNAKFNNVKSIKTDFEQSKQNADITYEIEKIKNKYILNALS
jgi:hypothetical protein